MTTPFDKYPGFLAVATAAHSSGTPPGHVGPEINLDDNLDLRLSAATAALLNLGTFADALAVDGHLPALHHEIGTRAISDMVVRDEYDVTLLLQPPGTGKSQYANVLAIAWIFARDPRAKVLLVSNTTELAERWGRKIRAVLMSDVYRALFPRTEIDPSVSAASRWNTTEGGEFLGVGSGAAILGFRANYIVIDDPTRTLEDATSEAVSARLIEWFDNELMTRLTPRGKVILVAQRLAHGDLPGHVIRKYGAPDSPRRLKVITLKMEREAGDPDDDTNRVVGDRLWPDWITEQQVLDAKMNPVAWRTLFQQQPVVGGSEFCSRDMVEIIDRAPPLSTLRIVQATDFALGENATRGDYTVHVIVGVDNEGNFYVLDVWRDRKPTLLAVDAMFQQVRAYRPGVTLLDNDMLARGLRQFIYGHGQTTGVHPALRFMPIGGHDKRARAAPLEGLVHLRRVKLLRASWNETLISELIEFPIGKHDDQVDALALCARHLLQIGRGVSAASEVTPESDYLAKCGVVRNERGQLCYGSTLGELLDAQDGGSRGPPRIP